jgi:hypothetical protein
MSTQRESVAAVELEQARCREGSAQAAVDEHESTGKHSEACSQ